MKERTPKGMPSLANNNGSLRIIVRYKGVRLFFPLALPDTKANREFGTMQVAIIRNDIRNNNFDPSFEKYKQDYQKKGIEPSKPDELTISQLWDRYVEFKKTTDIAALTIFKDYRRVSNHLAKLGITDPANAVAVRDGLLNRTTPKATKKVLTQLGAAFDWGIKSLSVTSNPFKGMAADIKLPKRSDDDNNIDPFSTDERDRIISFLKENHPRNAVLVEFMFRTGCRPGEAAGIQIKHINSSFSKLTFEQTVTESEHGLVVKKGLKTQERRVFPCGVGMQEFLRSIVPVDADREQFLFQSDKGKLFDFHNFSNRVWKPVLEKLDIKHRSVYQTRHSYITFCLDSGMNVKDVAKLCGNSAKVIWLNYAGAKRDLVAPDI